MNTLTDHSKVGDESEREPEERFSVEGQWFLYLFL